MKKLILFAVSIAMVYTAKAQSSNITYGVKGGGNLSNISNIAQNEKISFHAGVFAEWNICDFFAIQPELIYSHQGASDKVGLIRYNTNINYLNIPVLAKFYVLKGLSVDIGPQFGFVVDKKERIKVDGDMSKYAYDLDGVDRFDLSIGVGASYNIKSIILSAHYNFGLTDVFGEDIYDLNKNRVLQVSIGYRLSDLF